MTSRIHIVQTTLPGTWIEAEIGSFSQMLLEAGAACVQHSSIRSTYKWGGKIESSLEWRLQLKTSQSRLESVLFALKKSHPYEVPQIIHWAADSTQEYADWVDSD